MQAQARRVAVAQYLPIAQRWERLPDTVLQNWLHAAVGTLIAFLCATPTNATLLTGSTLQVEASDLLHLLDSVHDPGML